MSAASKVNVLTAAALFAAISIPVVADAQNNGGGGGGGANNNGGGGGGGGRGNPQQWRQRMLDRLKDQLGTSDDEFAALQPKIEKVFQLQTQIRGRGGRGGGGGGGGPGGDSAVAKAGQDLQETLDDKDAKPEDVKSKLDALRAARAAAKVDLTKAQDDLKGVLTARQEAVLVQTGMLE